MRSWTMRNATRRLRGSFSPSIIWMKPKVKSAPRPFSSGEERTRSLLSHRTGSWILFWPGFSLYYHCLPFLASQREPVLFSYSKRSSVKKRCATIYNCYRGTNLKHQPKFYPSFTLLVSEWTPVSLYHSLSEYLTPRLKWLLVLEKKKGCAHFSDVSDNPASHLRPGFAWSCWWYCRQCVGSPVTGTWGWETGSKERKCSADKATSCFTISKWTVLFTPV